MVIRLRSFPCDELSVASAEKMEDIQTSSLGNDVICFPNCCNTLNVVTKTPKSENVTFLNLLMHFGVV